MPEQALWHRAKITPYQRKSLIYPYKSKWDVAPSAARGCRLKLIKPAIWRQYEPPWAYQNPLCPFHSSISGKQVGSLLELSMPHAWQRKSQALSRSGIFEIVPVPSSILATAGHYRHDGYLGPWHQGLAFPITTLVGRRVQSQCHEGFLKLFEFYCCDFISQVIGPKTLLDKWIRQKMPHAARTVQSEEAMRCPGTKVQCFQHHLVYNCPGLCVLSPELPWIRHPLFCCALLLLCTIFICFDEKGLKRQSVTFESISWILAEDGAEHCCVLLVGSLLMICLNGRSQSSVLLWKHCTGLFVGSFLHLKQRMGEVGISGCHFRAEMTFLGDTSGWKAQEALVSTIYGCSSLPLPQVFN